jgi:hypothetical protein
MKKPKRRPQRPVTIEEVDRFLDSPVARRYYAFSDSNVKRRVVSMLLFLREEVDRLEGQLAPGEERAAAAQEKPRWVERVLK